MIIHLDLDAFFASCERLLNPGLKNRPIAVGGRGDPFIFDQKSGHNIDVTLENSGAFVPTLFYNAESSFRDYFVENDRIRGIVITSSYEARACGIKTGMTIREALQQSPGLIVLPPRHLFYHDRSHALKKWLMKRVPVLEQYSVDEFFGDLKGWIADRDVPAFIDSLRREIETTFGLPVSIGAAPSKWIAKLATSAAKPNGCKALFAKDVDAFVDPKPIEAFPGIGRGFSKRLKAYKIETLGELKAAKHLLYRWKKPGIQLYHRVNGDDNESVVAGHDRRSIGISRTIDPVFDRREIRRRLIILCRHLSHLVTKIDAQPKRLFLGIKYQFGQKAKRSVTEPFTFSELALRRHILELFEAIDTYRSLAIVRLGIGCGAFETRPTTRGSLFGHEREMKERRLWHQTAKIRQKYGIDTIRSAVEML
ncbi:DNA polymerase Y family protein [Hydrogenimonas cancrithermarum]|uniref:DNA polymerase IV n=1 Tax=Hydrogenimonas cancrithermarum TaxID=2993563 RepID=A0ABM8FLM3_9BACT|nr:DNA polymerase IV [Hydrogenimonas cancrithermarum]BDY13270.1 DNA polymerase IV [Hydrogenimonas cancrithermarum]